MYVAQISKIELWIDEGTWLPAQQQFFETGSGDYFIIRYTNVNALCALNVRLWGRASGRTGPMESPR